MWVILTNTMCQGEVVSCWEDDQPCLFATKQEAEAEVADHYISQLLQVERGERELDDFVPDEWVEPAEWDGENLTTEHHEWTATDLKGMR